jgi:hypothetical protein
VNPIPVPSKWIPWAVALACVVAFTLALVWPHPSPDTHALVIAHDSTVHAVAHMDSVRSRVKIAHAISNLRVKQLPALRDRVALTPNAVLVDGRDTLSGPAVGVIAHLVAAQDSTIAALEATVAVQDSALVADSLALHASLHETDVARALIPSKWQRVQTAARWGVIGGAVALVVRAVVFR